MDNLITYALTVFMSFFAIMNPIANTPIFMGLVDNQSAQSKKEIARTAVITAFIIVIIFVVAGKYIFELFGITIPSFKITGGIIIFYVGFEMLMSKKSSINNNNHTEEAKRLAISPLAIPILAGPGTIVTAMNLVTDASFIHVAIVVSVFSLMLLLTYWSFVMSDNIVKKIGINLISVVAKLMGLILAIIGTDMVISGVKLAFDMKS